jgi:hypothetical protein
LEALSLGSFFSHPDGLFVSQVHSQPTTYNNPSAYLSKLFEYHFSVEYQQGKLNVVADALSHPHEDTMGINMISSPSFMVYDALRAELAASPKALQWCAELVASTAPPGWSKVAGLLLFIGCVPLLVESLLWLQILEQAHTMGNKGGEKTLHRFWAGFYNPLARQCMRVFVKSCMVFQKNNTKCLHLIGLLHTTIEKVIYSGLKLPSVAVSEPLQMTRYW